MGIDMKTKTIFFASLLASLIAFNANAQQEIKHDEYYLGVFDKVSSQWILPMKFERIIEISDIVTKEKCYACKKCGKYALFTEHGKQFTHYAFDGVKQKKSGVLLVVSQNNKWGVIDASGNVVLPFEYRTVSFNLKGEAFASKDKETSSIKFSPSELKSLREKAVSAKTHYAYDSDLTELAAFYVNLPSTDGNAVPLHETVATKRLTVNDKTKLSMLPCINGYLVVAETNTNDTYVLDKEGNVISKFKSLWCSPFEKDGVAIAKFEDGTFSIINTAGKSVKNLGKLVACSAFEDGIALVASDEKIRTINTKGEFVLPFLDGTYSSKDLLMGGSVLAGHDIYPVSEGRRVFRNKGKFGYLDSSSKIVIEAKFTKATDFSDGLAAVAIEDGNQTFWGYIDKAGTFVIAPKFTKQPRGFSEGYAVVTKKDGNYCYINKAGEICSGDCRHASDFYGGHSIIQKGDEKPYVGDSSLHIIADTYCKGWNCYKAFGFLIDNYIYSLKGEPLVKLSGNTGKFVEDITYCRTSDKVGYINMKGEWIVVFEQKEF